MKKVLALMLSLIMVMGAFSVMAFAENTEDTEPLGEVIWNEDMLAGADLSTMFTVTNKGTNMAGKRGKEKSKWVVMPFQIFLPGFQSKICCQS